MAGAQASGHDEGRTRRTGPCPLGPAWRSNSPVMTYPEITKKTSTPTNPPRTGNPRVVGDHDQDGDGAQALDVRATPPWPGASRHVHSATSGSRVLRPRAPRPGLEPRGHEPQGYGGDHSWPGEHASTNAETGGGDADSGCCGGDRERRALRLRLQLAVLPRRAGRGPHQGLDGRARGVPRRRSPRVEDVPRHRLGQRPVQPWPRAGLAGPGDLVRLRPGSVGCTSGAAAPLLPRTTRTGRSSRARRWMRRCWGKPRHLSMSSTPGASCTTPGDMWSRARQRRTAGQAGGAACSSRSTTTRVGSHGCGSA